jgi:hypothetical protein
MKHLLAGFFVAVAATISSTPSNAMCISEQDIRDSKPSSDGRRLAFKMRDGRVLISHLRGICRDMRYTGFSWVLHGSHDVCENQTVIRVIQSGQTCILGKFEEAPTRRMPGKGF